MISSIVRCGSVPVPAEPTLSLPGFFLAVSMKPWNVVKGCDGWLTSSIGTRPRPRRLQVLLGVVGSEARNAGWMVWLGVVSSSV